MEMTKKKKLQVESLEEEAKQDEMEIANGEGSQSASDKHKKKKKRRIRLFYSVDPTIGFTVVEDKLTQSQSPGFIDDHADISVFRRKHIIMLTRYGGLSSSGGTWTTATISGKFSTTSTIYGSSEQQAPQGSMGALRTSWLGSSLPFLVISCP